MSSDQQLLIRKNIYLIFNTLSLILHYVCKQFAVLLLRFLLWLHWTSRKGIPLYSFSGTHKLFLSNFLTEPPPVLSLIKTDIGMLIC